MIINRELARLAELMNGETDPATLSQPKYVQLTNLISHMIESGDWKPGDRLPSEADLAKVLPVSLGTVQKALRRLSEQGAIVRKIYKGTYVTGPRSLLGPWHLRFLDDDGKTLLPVFQDVTSVERVSGEKPWAEFLGDSSYYVCINRLIDVDGKFKAVSRFFVSGSRFGSLLDKPIETLNGMYIRTVLRNQFGAATLRLEEQVSFETLSDDVCAELALGPGSVGMVFHIMSYGHRDAPISYHLVYVPPNSQRLKLSNGKL